MSDRIVVSVSKNRSVPVLESSGKEKQSCVRP